MLCHSITSLPLFKSHNYHPSPLPSSSSQSSSLSSSMSCSNPPPNFSRKPRISVRQVWRRTTLTPKSLPSSQNSSPLLPPRVNPQSPSLPPHNPLRDQMINQLHNISSILESQTQNSSNSHSLASPSPPSPLIRPPANAQVKFHSSFCHCCRYTRNHFHSLRNEINFIQFLLTRLIPQTRIPPNHDPPTSPFSTYNN
ncbi:hypothetical protein Tco_1434569 [Tanacetum coccineum]